MRSFEERSRNLPLDFAQSKALLVLAENEGVTQLARRFAEDVAAMYADEAAWLERPPRVTTARFTAPSNDC